MVPGTPERLYEASLGFGENSHRILCRRSLCSPHARRDRTVEAGNTCASPAAAYFGGQAALIALFTVAGVLVIYSLAQRYFDDSEDASLAELMIGGYW